MNRRLLAPPVALLALVLAAGSVLAGPFPAEIDLPAGWQPEGITAGRGTTVYAGSLANGAIAEVDVRTGSLSILAEGATGRVIAGIDYEEGRNRLWAAGGPTGQVHVFDADTGDLLQTYQFGAGFLNDVVVTHDAVYVTNSNAGLLAVIPLPADGSLPDPASTTTLPLSGDYVNQAGFNANGIVSWHGWLILVQSSTQTLYRVDPATGVATAIDLGGVLLPNGDGLELRGSRLYVVQNVLGQVAVVALDGDATSGEVVDTLPVAGSDVPTTAAFAAGRLWLVNARFGNPEPTTARYWISRLDP